MFPSLSHKWANTYQHIHTHAHNRCNFPAGQRLSRVRLHMHPNIHLYPYRTDSSSEQMQSAVHSITPVVAFSDCNRKVHRCKLHADSTAKAGVMADKQEEGCTAPKQTVLPGHTRGSTFHCARCSGFGASQKVRFSVDGKKRARETQSQTSAQRKEKNEAWKRSIVEEASTVKRMIAWFRTPASSGWRCWAWAHKWAGK